MFEVDWTDYSTENVAQRKARKEAERDQKKKEELRVGRVSISTRSSSSSGEKSFGFLSTIGLKKVNASSKTKKVASAALETIKDADGAKRDTAAATAASETPTTSARDSSAATDERSLSLLPPLDGHSLLDRFGCSWDNFTDRSSKGIRACFGRF
jgi:hypothetical protein